MPENVGNDNAAARAMDLVVAWCDDQLNRQGCTSISPGDQKPAGLSLRPLHVAILKVLAESEHVLMNQEDIAVAVHRSRTAIVKPLADLRIAGLVQRPHGERKGEAITEDGRSFLARVENRP
jgi:predicted transcriptional regulator